MLCNIKFIPTTNRPPLLLNILIFSSIYYLVQKKTQSMKTEFSGDRSEEV